LREKDSMKKTTKAEKTEIEEGGPETEDADELSPKQELALRALLSHRSMKEAALASGVGETTLWRYKKDEAFSRRLREVQQEIVGHAALRLRCESEEAVAVLGEIMRKQDAPPFARIAAARSIIEFTIRVGEMDELRRRIEELEDFIKLKQQEDLLDAAIRKEAEAKK
jgi:hypothetical protein